ncbi:UNVERIFIED_CONTAM: hypothetical protein GTU68_030832 [Idotea baltica]|nr:hypothetical protein [Idotea baltica]
MVAIENISPHLVRAVIAAEDSRFCQHGGVDTKAIRKAIDEHKAGKGLRGASTITQQSAKNVFFWNGGGFLRKAGDAWMATVVDFVWGKRRVMEVYLNVAEWGDGLFGAEAAAQARFGKSAADLTEREAALLAAVLPSPNKWRVDPPGPYVSKRAGTLQARMRVVAGEKLDACVWGDKVPKPNVQATPPAKAPVKKPETASPVTPAPEPEREAVPDLQNLPEPLEDEFIESAPPINSAAEGDGRVLAPMPSPNDAATDALDAFLDEAEGSFSSEPVPDTETASPETEQAPVELKTNGDGPTILFKGDDPDG